MSLTIDEVTVISRRVAAEIDPQFMVVAVSSTDREAGRVELLITIQGCHRDPCQLVVNVPRVNRDALDHALRNELTATLRQHTLDT